MLHEVESLSTSCNMLLNHIKGLTTSCKQQCCIVDAYLKGRSLPGDSYNESIGVGTVLKMGGLNIFNQISNLPNVCMCLSLNVINCCATEVKSTSSVQLL